MGRISYEQAFEDWSYLWEVYGPAADMTGGYVDQADLDRLLRSPTKATARDCLCCQIDHWFGVGTEDGGRGDPNDERLREIAERHGADYPS